MRRELIPEAFFLFLMSFLGGYILNPINIGAVFSISLVGAVLYYKISLYKKE